MIVSKRLDYLEGLGDNCELGFTLMQHHYGAGCFFRWVSLTPAAMLAGLKHRLDGIYQFRNLFPHPGNMVRDVVHDMAFHSKMHSSRRGGALVFDDNADARRALFEPEAEKAAYLRGRFLERLAVPDMVYCLKAAAPGNAFLTELDRTLAELRGGAPFKLLHVEAARGEDVPGSVVALGGNVWRGFVARHAPISQADQGDAANWERILDATLPPA